MGKILVEMEVERTRDLGNGLVEVWGHVGDYELMVCLPASRLAPPPAGPAIDQARRRALCRAILQGSDRARLQLARLYQRAGQRHLAALLRERDSDNARIHAESVLARDG